MNIFTKSEVFFMFMFLVDTRTGKTVGYVRKTGGKVAQVEEGTK